LVVCLLAFFATFVLANGTKQRTFPTTVFIQQLEGKKKEKKGCGKLSGFAGKKSKKQQQKQFHQYSDRRLSVMCMCALNLACCGCE
jgi:hypothetical protein